MHVITPIHSKRYIRTYRMRVYIFNRLVWLNMIYYAVRKMEIDIPERDMQSKSPSDCSIDLCSILWFYCRLWFIVSDDERIDLKESIFLLKNSHFHGGNFSSVLFVTLFHSKAVIPLLYISPIFLGNIVVSILMTAVIISLPRPWREFSGYRWILTSAKVPSSLMTVSLKRQFLLYMAA